MTKAAVARLALAILVACAGACTLPGNRRQPDGCPVVPVAATALADEVPLRLRMHLTGRGVDARFETIASLEGGSLVVVGIAPYGIRLFSVRQRGSRFEILDDRSGSAAAGPVWAVDAIHRSFWIRRPEAAGSARSASWEREGETVRDHVAEDGGRSREFTRPRDHARVSIEYAVAAGGEEPAAIAIRNPWCGYEGRIVVLDGPSR